MKVSFIAEEDYRGSRLSGEISLAVVCPMVQRVKKPKAGRQDLFLKEDSHQVSVEQGCFYLLNTPL